MSPVINHKHIGVQNLHHPKKGFSQTAEPPFPKIVPPQLYI